MLQRGLFFFLWAPLQLPPLPLLLPPSRVLHVTMPLSFPFLRFDFNDLKAVRGTILRLLFFSLERPLATPRHTLM